PQRGLHLGAHVTAERRINFLVDASDMQAAQPRDGRGHCVHRVALASGARIRGDRDHICGALARAELQLGLPPGAHKLHGGVAGSGEIVGDDADANDGRHRTCPRAATFHEPSTRARRPYQISSCRFTVEHTWLGTTHTFSPTHAGSWIATYPCSSFFWRIVQRRPMKWPNVPGPRVASLENVFDPPSIRHWPGTAVLTTVVNTRSAQSASTQHFASRLFAS